MTPARIRADRTDSRILPDLTSDENIHEIEVEGNPGKLSARMEDAPSLTNPKTTDMAALSATALLRRITSFLDVETRCRLHEGIRELLE